MAAMLAPASASAETIDCIDTAEQAQQLRLDGRLTRAREKLLACSQTRCPSIVRSDCSRWLSEVDELMPSLVLRAVDGAGGDVIDVRVEIDNQLITERLDGSEIHVDPGQHVFRFTRAGAPPIEQTVLVREGEQHRRVSVVCPGPVSVPSPQTTLLGAQPSRADPPRPLQAAVSGPRIPLVWPVATIGAGGIALAGAAILWVSGLSDRASLVSGCGTTHSCQSSDVDSAHRKLVIGDVTAAAGVGLVAVGVGILIFGQRPAEHPVTAGIQPIPQGALLGVRGTL